MASPCHPCWPELPSRGEFAARLFQRWTIPAQGWSADISAPRLQRGCQELLLLAWLFLLKPSTALTPTQISHITPHLQWLYLHEEIAIYWTGLEKKSRVGDQVVTNKARCVSWLIFQSISFWSALSVNIFVFGDVHGLFVSWAEFARGWGEGASLVSCSAKIQALLTPSTELVLVQESDPSLTHIQWELTCTHLFLF